MLCKVRQRESVWYTRLGERPPSFKIAEAIGMLNSSQKYIELAAVIFKNGFQHVLTSGFSFINKQLGSNLWHMVWLVFTAQD